MEEPNNQNSELDQPNQRKNNSQILHQDSVQGFDPKIPEQRSTQPVLSSEAPGANASVTPPANNQNLQATTKKPNKTFLIILAASFVDVIISSTLAYLFVFIFVLLNRNNPAVAELGFLGLIVTGFFFDAIILVGSIILFSWLISKQLIKRNIISLSSKKATSSILGISLILFFILYNFVQPLIANMRNTKPGYEAPVSQWNQFKNADYSFSYPKDTNLDQKNSIAGEIDEALVSQTNEQYQKVNQVPLNENQSSVDLFDVSIVNPDYYKNDVIDGSSPAKTYAEKVYQLNKADFSKTVDESSYSNVDGKEVTTTQIAGKTAYGFSVVYLFKNPGGIYPIRQVNGYSKGSAIYYYVDYKGKVYQVWFPSQNEIGLNILQTLKFESDLSGKEYPSPILITYSTENYIGYFNLDTKDKTDVTLPSGTTDNNLIGLTKDTPVDFSGQERTDFRISPSTQFVIGDKVVDRSQIEKISNQKKDYKSGIEVKYKQAKVEYNSYISDAKGNTYFVATKIILFENANSSDNTPLPSNSSSGTSQDNGNTILLSSYDIDAPTTYQTQTGHVPIQTSGVVQSFSSTRITITDTSDSSVTSEGFPISSNTTITDGKKATSLAVGKKVQLEYGAEGPLLRVWVEN